MSASRDDGGRAARPGGGSADSGGASGAARRGARAGGAADSGGASGAARRGARAGGAADSGGASGAARSGARPDGSAGSGGAAAGSGGAAASGSYQAHFRVWRGDAAGGGLADFRVEVNEGEVVLDIVHRLQATQAPDLAVRWNCKAGKCGSCSAEINGRPRLLCMTRMSVFGPAETVTITPLRAFPVVRDLVTDVSFNYAKAREVPSFVPPEGLAPGEYRMAQEDVARSQEFRKCIECFLCQDTCHVVRDFEENKAAFAGPRFLMRIAELDMHPLDAAAEAGLDRRRTAQQEHGLGYCNITKCCTEVCPESIRITDNALIPLKERVVDRRYDPLVWLGSRIRRRRD